MRTALGCLLALSLSAVLRAQASLPPDLRALADGFVSVRPVPAELVAALETWEAPADPVRIVGPIHFVGTKGLAAYLITTPKGHILLDGGMPASAASIEASIRRLGFKPEDIRLLLITHAHIDHAGTTAHFQKLSGGDVAVMDRDLEALKSGGKTDFQYGKLPAFYFPAATASRTLKDGDSVSLGNVTMMARLGAGHTKGATTWITRVEDGGRTYDVVFPCCTSINPGYRLTVDPSYPGIDDDYRRTIAMLESLQPQIWLTAHTDVFDFEKKRARAATEGVSAWVDPEGYRAWVASGKSNFEKRIAKESATKGGPEARSKE